VHTRTQAIESRSPARAGRVLLITAALAIAVATAVGAADTPAGHEAEATAPAGPASVAAAVGEDAHAAGDVAARWGVEVTSIRLTAHNHMIDFRYRVLDADKAADLFKRQIKPHLVDQKTGLVLSVPETAKVGPLRNSNTPQEGRIYWMFFGNAGFLVKPGDKVTVTIGDFRVENLVVE